MKGTNYIFVYIRKDGQRTWIEICTTENPEEIKDLSSIDPEFFTLVGWMFAK